MKQWDAWLTKEMTYFEPPIVKGYTGPPGGVVSSWPTEKEGVAYLRGLQTGEEKCQATQ